MRIATVLLFAAVSGCATNGFSKFYTPSPALATIMANPAIVAPPKEPKVFTHSNNVDADAKRLREDGYICIGTSSFYGPSKMGDKDYAIEQGKKVGAALIMLKSSYKDTLNSVLPLTLPNGPQVATVNTNGTMYSNGSSGSYNSTSTVTMPGGSTTTYIPYAVSRSDFFASYWANFDPSKRRLGLDPSPLPDEVRNRLKRNTGAFVQIVSRGTPAFVANVLEGDVIIKINDADVVDAPSFVAQLPQYDGQAVELGILRDGQPITVHVQLNKAPK